MSAVRRSQTAAAVSFKPPVEPLTRVMRQRSLRGNAERCLHQTANRSEIDEGLIGADLRHPPQPLHCSRLPMRERSLNAKASRGSNGNSIGLVKLLRK